MNAKTCVITGATSGIGLGIAKGLANKNYNLVLIGRNETKGRETVKSLQQVTSSSINYFNADLSSQKQIRSVGEQIKQSYPVIDVLINNAGIWTSKYELTEDSVEKQFAVNHLAYFLLTQILYPSLANAADARVINIASDSHFYGKINFDDLNLQQSYHGLKAYGQSKLANVLFTYELNRIKRENHVSVHCVQPGLVKTDIGVKHTNPFHSFMWKLRRLTGQSPEKAAETAIYLASSTELVQQSGLYWDRCKPKASSKRSYNVDDAKRLWRISEDLCGVKNYFT